MSNFQPEGFVSGFEGVMGAMVGAAMLGAANGRARAASIRANEANCFAAAAVGRAGVLTDTVGNLRSQLAEVRRDLEFSQDEADGLRRDVAALKTFIRVHGLRSAA